MGEKGKFEIHVDMALLPLGYLPIQGKLQKLLFPFAGKKIRVDTGGGKPLECRLNAAGTLLKSRKLAELITLTRRVLVLTPPSLVEQWREEMQSRFNLDFVTYDSPAFKSTPRPWTNLPRIIASIDTAKREPHKDMVLEPVYDLVIVDEAHHLKKQRTQAYQLVSQLKKKYILLLTATPVENELEELFNLITLLQPGHLETASTFKKKYITRGDPLKPKNAEDLKKLVREVMVRNRRSETGVITSRRRAEVVEVALSPEEAAFYRRLTSFVRGYYTPGSNKISGGVNQGAGIHRNRQRRAQPAVLQCHDQLRSALEPDAH